MAEEFKKFDDASWHTVDGETKWEEGCVHIGLYLAFMREANLVSIETRELLVEALGDMDREQVSPRDLARVIDGKFSSQDLNEEGDQFTRAYYDSTWFFEDLFTVESVAPPSSPEATESVADVLASLASFAPAPPSEEEPPAAQDREVRDDWATYDEVAPALRRRLEQWRNGELPTEPPPDARD